MHVKVEAATNVNNFAKWLVFDQIRYPTVNERESEMCSSANIPEAKTRLERVFIRLSICCGADGARVSLCTSPRRVHVYMLQQKKDRTGVESGCKRVKTGLQLNFNWVDTGLRLG
jgi:hypothetical protein